MLVKKNAQTKLGRVTSMKGGEGSQLGKSSIVFKGRSGDSRPMDCFCSVHPHTGDLPSDEEMQYFCFVLGGSIRVKSLAFGGDVEDHMTGGKLIRLVAASTLFKMGRSGDFHSVNRVLSYAR